MPSTGIFRRVDALGRFVLPKELRNSLGIQQNDYLQIMLEGDTIVLKKAQMGCIFCDSTEELSDFQDKKICAGCLAALQAMPKE